MIYELKNIDNNVYYFNSYNMLVGNKKEDVVDNKWDDRGDDWHPIDYYKETLFGKGDGAEDSNDTSDNLKIDLNLNTKCNCCCTYCFRVNGQNVNVGYDVEKAKKIIDIVFDNYYGSKIRKSGSYNFTFNISLTGEPFIDSESLWKIVYYIRDKSYNLGIMYPQIMISTNGTNISVDDIHKMIDNMKIFFFSISIDGDKSVQDKLRPMINGESSYDKILEFIQKYNSICDIKKYPLLKNKFGASVTIVPNIPEQHDIMKQIKHLISIGFSNINFQPIKKSDECWTDEEYYDIINRYIDFFKKLQTQVILNGDLKVLQACKLLSESLTQINMRYVFSSCGEIKPSQLVIDANGNIYGCDHYVGNKHYTTDFNIFNFDKQRYVEYKRNEILKRLPDNFEECSSCKYKYLCGGKGFICHVHGNKTLEMHCALQKIIFNAMLNIYEYMFRKNDYDKSKLDKYFERNKLGPYRYY